MTKMTLNDQSKRYMKRMLGLFLEGKLAPGEVVQLFQDIYDSGYYLNLNTENRMMVLDLVKRGILEERVSSHGTN